MSFPVLVSTVVMLLVYGLLISEKIHKTVVAILAAGILVLLQVFATDSHTSQAVAFEYISSNLDIFTFIIGMMILVNIVKESGFFEFVAINLVKKAKGNPYKLMLIFGYMAFAMTALFSNIPTIIILSPLILIVTCELHFLPSRSS